MLRGGPLEIMGGGGGGDNFQKKFLQRKIVTKKKKKKNSCKQTESNIKRSAVEKKNRAELSRRKRIHADNLH